MERYPNVTPFGVMPNGAQVEEIALKRGALSCRILTYGGTIRTLTVPDRTGRPVDVVLGLDSLEDYRRHTKHYGALIGRFANRIGGARFTLGGREYLLAANDRGTNHLHGGPTGFDRQVWTVETASQDAVTLSLFSPDGHEGYPGGLFVWVTYTLTEQGLEIEYSAVCARDTLCSLTNHSYFNLSGHDSGPVSDQTIQIFADRYTPTDSASIPTGEIAPVEGTPMDLRKSTPIGAHVDDGFPQLVMAGGYDHNWVLNAQSGELALAARAVSPRTGIVMETWTTLPGVQFYSGNYLDGGPAGKGGAPYAKRWAFCLETQYFPDAPNHPGFPSAVLRAGERYKQKTAYRFGLEN